MIKIFKIYKFTLTIWKWTKLDNRQKKPTTGFGFIIERI